MRVGPEQTAGPAEAEVRSTASRGIDAASWSVAAIAASAHGGIRRPALCLEEAEVSLFPVRDFSRRLRIPSEFAYLCKIRKVMDNFIVSARKYRPATFASVVGQSHITSTLRNAIARRQLAHAYLFCGPRGVGKTTCARIFAKAINCLDPAADGEACNECESCRAFNEGRSFNIHELDAASNNSVDDIRTLTEQVRIPPQIGRYSVYIIDEVHMLSLQAFNAFLKTLEEPPAHAVFILATTEKHKIIPTILSRCQIYDFNRIRVEDGVGYLKYIASQEGVAYDDESLHIIAQKADGGMRDALSMFDKVVSFCGQRLTAAEVAATLNVLDYDTYFGMTSRILAGDYPAALMMFDEVLRKGFSAQTFAAGLNGHFRDLLMCKNPQTLSLLEVTGSVAERYRSQAAECPVPLLFEGIDLLTAVEQSLRTAVNQRLRVELSLMKLCGLGQKKNDGVALGTSYPLPPLTGQKKMTARRARPCPNFRRPAPFRRLLPRRRSLRPRESFLRRLSLRLPSERLLPERFRRFRLRRYPHRRKSRPVPLPDAVLCPAGLRAFRVRCRANPFPCLEARAGLPPPVPSLRCRLRRPDDKLLRLRRLLPHRLIRLFPRRPFLPFPSPADFPAVRRLPLPPARSFPFLCRAARSSLCSAAVRTTIRSLPTTGRTSRTEMPKTRLRKIFRPTGSREDARC